VDRAGNQYKPQWETRMSLIKLNDQNRPGGSSQVDLMDPDATAKLRRNFEDIVLMFAEIYATLEQHGLLTESASRAPTLESGT
jgi:hypothetical protein